MNTVEGLNGIKATVLAYSITQAGKKLITWEIEYPRLILAELNTHRQLSRNSFSSRAVPFFKMLEQLTGEPVRFGANQSGMQDKGFDFDAPVYLEVDDPYDNYGVLFSKQKKAFSPRTAWHAIKNIVVELARGYSDAGYHKQIYNRLLEPWQMQKSVLSATEVDNFFWLRDDDQADPTIHELARVMKQAMDEAKPQKLYPGEWHLPYIDFDVMEGGGLIYYIKSDAGVATRLTVEEAIKVSCARCAAVSYRNEGYGLAKSLELYERLVGSDKKHASALEHCATPMQDCQRDRAINVPTWFDTWEHGITHVTRDSKLWSGNFQGWIQFRKTIKGECYNAA